MKCKGKGDYQRTLDILSKVKVLHRLSIKPYNYQQLWHETRIQRNRLRRILEHFVDKKIVIPHKFRWIKGFTNNNRDIQIKPGLTYYILDLSINESLTYLTDARSDTIVKDYVKFSKIFPVASKRKGQGRDVWGNKTPTYRKPSFEVKRNKRIQLIKMVKNMDMFFTPWLYSPEQKDNFLKIRDNFSFFTDLRNKNPELYSKFKTVMSDPRTSFDNNVIIFNYKGAELTENKARNLLAICKTNNLSKYDFLIYTSWNFPSRENYIEIWNMIKDLK